MSLKMITAVMSTAFLATACNNRGPQDFDSLWTAQQNEYRRCVSDKRQDAAKTANEAVAAIRTHSELPFAEVDKLGRSTPEAMLKEISIIRAARDTEAPLRKDISRSYIEAVNAGYLSCAAQYSIKPASLPKAYQQLTLENR